MLFIFVSHFVSLAANVHCDTVNNVEEAESERTKESEIVVVDYLPR